MYSVCGVRGSTTDSFSNNQRQCFIRMISHNQYITFTGELLHIPLIEGGALGTKPRRRQSIPAFLLSLLPYQLIWPT
jgi:hypothetical protein